MKIKLLLVMSVIVWCGGVRLSPMENNDKLQDINSLFVAEWQWESWPVKQELTEQDGKTPGQRKNVALWKDSSKSAWYLFGGQPISGDTKKVYSDVWKFTVKTRVWKRVLSSQEEVKDAFTNKKGLEVSINNASHFESRSQRVVLCGGLDKKNLTTPKPVNLWSSFKRRKFEEKKDDDDLSYLALYEPKSNTIRQVDVKKKQWTTYVCSFNTTQNETDIKSANSSIGPKEKIPSLNSDSSMKNDSSTFDSKVTKAEDKAENEQQHSDFNNLKNKKKKINQMRKNNEKFHLKQIKIEKKAVSKKEKNTNETKTLEQDKSKSADYENNTKSNSTEKEHVLKKSESSEKKPKTEKSELLLSVKITTKDCPEFAEDETPLAWCDGRNEAFITADINSPQITLQVFNLTTGQWSQIEVIDEGEEWQNCTNKNSIRFAGIEEEVYMICSQPHLNTTNPSEIPSETNYNTKLVYKINYKDGKLRSLGRILLNPYFNSVEGEKVWQNTTLSVLEVIKNSENETILILAFLDMVDLWILNRNHENKESFELTEKVWRGSALKWFDKYNAALYSLQFVSESEKSETILLVNPRNIEPNEYWPRERGRFIIRIFRNENLKNQTFENRTRDQNLTYELLQSDYKPSGVGYNVNHTYSLKVLIFFGISLAMFTLFGFFIFMKRCVSFPPRIRIRNDYHKTPLIIRYSVIPDDLLFPVA